MLKKRTAPYPHGRKRGVWWKWKLDPYTVDAVLMYAQRGHGRRASLYTDYTFGVWQGDQLVPFAKAYSGLTDAEIREVNKQILSLTLEKFGPVRTVIPKIVCEIAFEGISLSNRHRAGIAVRFPRIHRLRRDKLPKDADTVDSLKALIPTGPFSRVGGEDRIERNESKG
jgi:DNA ligase-1